MNRTAVFRRARDFLVAHRTDYDGACRGFEWPRPECFNWAIDWFDAIARGNTRTALRIVGDGGLDAQLTFDELRRRSNFLAEELRSLGLVRGDRVLLMLGNVPALWELTLACMKLGCPIIPTTTLLMPSDLRDRVERGAARVVITDPVFAERFEGTAVEANAAGQANKAGQPDAAGQADAVGRADAAGQVDAVGQANKAKQTNKGGEAGAAKEPVEAGAGVLRVLIRGMRPGWHTLAETGAADDFDPGGDTLATDPLFLYFTSGTTAKPKLVVHTHVSYPIGHLSTMYWLGLRPGDRHLNLSSPGWAKHAWSSFFAPWNAEATIVMVNHARFDASSLVRELARCEVTSFCAPPTVWRSIIQLPLDEIKVSLRELASAGEPLNPEVIARVQKAWGLTIRDGYGQTETTAQIGNCPGQVVKPGSMGRVLPGYRIELLDLHGNVSDEGEICVSLPERPVPVMPGYLGDPVNTAAVMVSGFYHAGDIARRDGDGYFTYVGRNDDVFKCSDYKISPFELESLLVEHEAVVEAAVVPSPDAQRLSVPKAFVILAAGHSPSRELAAAILKFVRERTSPFKRIRRIEFADLPKTVSGKIRRVDLRRLELTRELTASSRNVLEYWEEDL